MSRLMIGNRLLFPHLDHLAPVLQPAHDAVDGIQEILLLHHALVLPGGNQRRLVRHIRYIRPREPRRLLRQERHIHVRPHAQRFQVHLENLLPIL